MLIYLETSPPHRVNNVLKLPGVLRLMLRKTGKQRCQKTQAFLAKTVETGDESATACFICFILIFAFIMFNMLIVKYAFILRYEA